MSQDKDYNKAEFNGWCVSRHPSKDKYYIGGEKADSAITINDGHKQFLVYDFNDLQDLAIAILSFEKKQFEKNSICGKLNDMGGGDE